jgi:hypothetical protein
MKTATVMGSLVVCGVALGVPQLTAYSIAGGGGQVSGSGTLTVSYTIGACDVTPAALATGSYEVCGGYWPRFEAPLCAADINHDGGIDFFDYLDFVDFFSSGAPEADFNHDGSADFFDYLDFVDAFSIGC